MNKFSVILIVGCLVYAVHAIGPLGTFGVGVGSSKCEPSITTASGPYAIHKGNSDTSLLVPDPKIHPKIQNNAATGQYCSGDLIFEDTFDIFDLRKWQHENTLTGNDVSDE